MAKKVLIISMQFYPEIGSSGNRMKNIFNVLNQKYEVDVLTCEPNYPNKALYTKPNMWNEEKLNNLPNISRIPIEKKKHSNNMINRLHLYLQVTLKMIKSILSSKNHYDVVYVTTPPIFLGIVGLVARWKFKAKFVLDIRDLWPDSLKGVKVFDYKWIISIFKLLEKKLYINSDLIIINSEGFYQKVTKLLKIEKPILFLPNALNKEELSIQKQKLEDFSVIYTGNIGLAQNVEFLKALLYQLNENNIPINIVAYGVKLNELKQFVMDNNLSKVHFQPMLGKNACLQYTKQHHVGIVSLTKAEVFKTVLPGKLIDYISCGLPVIGAVRGYAKDVIKKNELGFVSELDTIEEYVDFLLELKNSSKLYERFAAAALEYGKENYQWEKNGEGLIEEIEKIVRKS